MRSIHAAAVLAGGEARRLQGRDKCALMIGGQRSIDRQLDLLRQVAEHLLIVANVPARYEGLGVPIVPDLKAGCGALGGVYTAITAAPAPEVLVVACDLPFLN